MPIIPDYLFTLDANTTVTTEEDENGRVGLLLSSKALVQLIWNPVVGILIGKLGYAKPLLLGNLSLFLATLRKRLRGINNIRGCRMTNGVRRLTSKLDERPNSDGVNSDAAIRCRFSVHLWANVQSAILSSEHSRYSVSVYRSVRHIPGRLAILRGKREIQDHGFCPRQYRSGRSPGISDWLRPLRSRGKNGAIPAGVLLHYYRNL